MDRILEGLNDQQKCAVISTSPALQVLAPPGSGKTKTLSSRVAWLIDCGMEPSNIIVCTFTKKAAFEMKDRIKNFVGQGLQSKLVAGTFHSVGRRYLNYYGQHIGIKNNFGIADSSDTLSILKRLIKKHSFQIEAAKARTRISKRKSSNQVERKNVAQMSTGQRNTGANEQILIESQEFEDLFEKYQEELELQNLLDYDDILIRCVELLKKHPECVANIQAVLIDEFQDTNHIQYELMSLFCQHKVHKKTSQSVSLSIVGDPDQSIYSFRNAEIGNLKKMRDDYPDHQVVNLEENYRSAGAILKASMAVIEQDEDRHSKSMQPTHIYGSLPILKTLKTADKEAEWIIKEIQRLKGMSGEVLSHADFAILLRSAHLSRRIESQLGQAGIPYRMVGGNKFFERHEIRVLIDYLLVVAASDHSEALRRVLNTPSRTIGETASTLLITTADKLGWTLWKLLQKLARGEPIPTGPLKLSKQASAGIDQLVDVILSTQKRLHSSMEQKSLDGLIKFLIQKLAYESYLKKKCNSNNSDFESKLDNLEELIKLASTVALDDPDSEEQLVEVDDIDQSIPSGPAVVLSNFLANVALSSATTETELEGGQVTISTIHAAKGLEWPIVFIPAAYEGNIPHSRSEDTNEERRLLFVGMTRAKALLYISRPEEEGGFNNDRKVSTESSFLQEASMKEYFSRQGPSMTISVVQDLARILGRDCPVQDVLTQIFCSLNYAEDDFDLQDQYEREHSSTGLQSDNNVQSLKAGFSRLIQRQNSSGFSRPNQNDFQSARQEVTRESVKIGMAASSGSGFQKASLLPRVVQPVESVSTSHTKQQVGQSVTSKKTKIPPRNQKTLAGFGFGLASTLKEEFPKPNGPQKEHVTTRSTNEIPVYNNNPTKSTPSDPALHLDRKIRAGPHVNRKRGHDDIEKEPGLKDRYLLLSSSPSKPVDDMVLMQLPDQRLNSQNSSYSRPSLHTTTCDRLSSNQQPIKRRYGMTGRR